MSKVLKEIPSITDKDCFYIVDRHKSEFTWPIHSHEVYELNFIERGKGVVRVVGDSIEEIGDYELTLITGEGLEHAWEQGKCQELDIREVTIQFSPHLLGPELLERNQFVSVRKMFELARRGLTFSMSAIVRVYSLIDTLASKEKHMEQFLDMLKILYELSLDTGARTLASRSFAKAGQDRGDRRVDKIKEFVVQHYMEEVKLVDLAALVAMTPPAFSRYFKQQTGVSPMDYIIDVRLGVAARMLVDTSTSISEICYACGFNNLSNFNRSFKAHRGYTPRDFRALFTKNKIFV